MRNLPLMIVNPHKFLIPEFPCLKSRMKVILKEENDIQNQK